jgi:hypothetical protein
LALSLFVAQQTFTSLQPKAASEKEWLERATTAWKYFQPNVGMNANTGLNYGASEWHRLTDWDLGTYIQATLAAEKLGILQREGDWGSDSRIEKILLFLEKRPITDKKLPYGQYDAETGQVQDDMKNSSVHPSDWGRLLLALDDLRHARPDLEKRIGAVVTRCDNKILGESGYFATPDIYPFYVAQGYWAFGYTTPKLRDLAVLGNGATIDVYGLSFPKARITSDPLLLAILEERTGQTYRTYADRMYEAQKRRYEQTGTLTAYGEGAYPISPYYAYEWITTADGQQWVIQAPKGPEMLYTKIAFAMHAIYSDDYTAKLIEKASSTVSEKGFYEGAASDGSTLQVLTDKTNSMILQAAAYARQRVEGSSLDVRDGLLQEITGTATKCNRPDTISESSAGSSKLFA